MPYPHIYLTLMPEEKKKIKDELQRLTYLKQWKKRKPLQTLYLSDQKKPFQDIANHLKVTYRTVQRWIAKYRKESIDGFVK